MIDLHFVTLILFGISLIDSNVLENEKWIDKEISDRKTSVNLSKVLTLFVDLSCLKSFQSTYFNGART